MEVLNHGGIEPDTLILHFHGELIKVYHYSGEIIHARINYGIQNQPIVIFHLFTKFAFRPAFRQYFVLTNLILFHGFNDCALIGQTHKNYRVFAK